MNSLHSLQFLMRIPMNLTIISAFTTIIFVSCISNNDKQSKNPEAQKAMADTANFTTIQWIDSVKNFGKIQEGQKLDVTFRFKNTGTKPLVIADVKASCGCTVVEKPTKPVMPGEESEIRGSFDSEGHPGANNKNIIVEANTKPAQNFQLKFSAEVERKN